MIEIGECFLLVKPFLRITDETLFSVFPLEQADKKNSGGCFA